MRIEDRFTVSLPIEEAWKVLLDIERIAPCMPGAQLQEITEEEYRGIVKVKLGAINAQYKGAVRIAEADQAGHRIVLRAEGRETKGQGNASANVVATLVAVANGGTQVAIETDLTITGRIAQFGRGVMADVSAKLLGDFARCLEEDLAGETGKESSTGAGSGAAVAAGEASAGEASPGSGRGGGEALLGGGDRAPGASAAQSEAQSEAVPHLVGSTREPQPIDLLAVAGPSVFQRLMPAAIVGVLLALVGVKGRAKRGVLSVVGTLLVVAQAGLARRS